MGRNACMKEGVSAFIYSMKHMPENKKCGGASMRGQFKIFCVYEIMRRNCNGIYSVLEQIRKRLSEETTYTEGVSEVPEGEDPSFEANQVASGYSLPWDSGDRKNPGL